jgi:hypothetical protein
MGFFKKIFKGIKKVFKKIGRGIKKGFAKFGKFMNKIGIVGQIAMMFILPGIGGALLKGLGTLGATLSASSSLILQGAGAVLQGAANFATTVGNVFSTVTKGITEFGKTALNKIPGINIKGAAANFMTGPDSALARVKIDASKILDPWKKTIAGKGRTLADISKSTGVSVEDLAGKNYDIRAQLGDDPSKWGDFTVGQDTEIWTQTAKPMKILKDQAFDIDVGEMVKSAPSTAVHPSVEGTTYEAYKTQFEASEAFIPETTVPMGDSLLAPKPEVTIPDSTGGSDAYNEMMETVRSGLEEEFKPQTTDPTGKSFVGRTWDATKRQYFSDPITGIKTVKRGVDWYSGRQQEDPTVRYGGGVLPGLGYYGLEDFQARGTVSAGEQLLELKKQGLWGLSAHLDEQMTWRQQLNKNLALGLGGGT